VDFEPVFIIGDHRSGTTVLYQVLARTGAFNVVTAYHVLRNAEFVSDFAAGREDAARGELAAEFARLGLTDRGIDGVRVTPDLPEEYGFVIDPSPRPSLRPATLPALVDLCRRIRQTGGARPVLLKNPWDVLGFAFVKQSFPRARLIFVHRHPLGVMNSQFAATRSLLAGRNEYAAMLSPWYRGLYDRPFRLRVARAMNGWLGPRIVGRHVVKATRYYLEHIAAVPGGDYVEIRYEDLCAEPDATLRRVLSFLGIDPPPETTVADLVRPRQPAILGEILERYRRIRSAMAGYCRRLGYDLEGMR
jgi:hypothetical protein